MNLTTNTIVLNSRNTIGQKTTHNLVITEIEHSINNTIKFIENELHLNDILIKQQLPILLNECAYQFKLLLNATGNNTLDYLRPTHPANVNNFFIRTILYQMKDLKESNPLALLAWIVVLFHISKLIYSNLHTEIANFVQLHWKEIALHWISEELTTQEIAIYQTSLASNLIDSTVETADPIFNE